MKFKPIDTAPIPEFSPERWWMPDMRCMLATSNGFVFIGSYSYTKTGKGRWRSHGTTVYPAYWAPMPAFEVDTE